MEQVMTWWGLSEMAYEMGHEAGQRGEDDNPFFARCDEFHDWEEGWHDWQVAKEIAEAKKKVEKSD